MKKIRWRLWGLQNRMWLVGHNTFEISNFAGAEIFETETTEFYHWKLRCKISRELGQTICGMFLLKILDVTSLAWGIPFMRQKEAEHTHQLFNIGADLSHQSFSVLLGSFFYGPSHKVVLKLFLCLCMELSAGHIWHLRALKTQYRKPVIRTVTSKICSLPNHKAELLEFLAVSHFI